jgi:hypothetical protein
MLTVLADRDWFMSNKDRFRRALQHPVCPLVIGYTAICTWPALNALAHNEPPPHGVELSEALALAGLSGLLWLVGMAAAVAPRLIWDRWSVSRALTVAVTIVIGLFSHQSVRQSLVLNLGLGGVVPTVTYLLVLGVLIVSVWRWSGHGSVRLVMSISAVLFTAQAAAGASRMTSRPPADGREPAPAPAVAGRGVSPDRLLENVYFIVLDEYGGARALQKYLGLDINPFIEQMKERGYSHLESSRSNYVSTYLSLTATLEMDYVMDESSPRHQDQRTFFPQALQRGWSPQVMTQSALAGRDFVYVGSHYIPCGRWPGVICVEEADASYRYTRAVRQFFAPTDIPHALTMLQTSGDYGSLKPLSNAIETLAQWPRPFFAVVHVISPHAPYHRADCSRYWRGDRDYEQYKTTIECVNRAVVALATRLAAVDPEAIVVFQADHGSGSNVDWERRLSQWTDAAIDERSSILSLVRLPVPCREWLRPDLSSVNTMRLVSGCLARHRPEYVENRSFINTNHRANADFGTVREVTDRLRSLQK